ncbi:MAG: U32 family peptidase [Kiritimatiellae bacterium]|nr:U32 family peptidase [Kiritimatiellia bacterium]
MSVELLSPAGDFETALAAFDAGADAVYCGLADFSARAYAKNLSTGDLRRLMRVARSRGKKVYVTFNTLVEEGEMDRAAERLAELEAIGPDAVIVQDLGVARLAHEYFPSLALHASTQLVAHNLEGVLALKDLGFTRVVTARELSADELASISRRSGGMEFEAFIHGALCYSISGLCLFSAMEKGRSGNRGECAYCCRLPYADAEGNKVLAFSMKDLRLGEDARKLIDAGVCSLKIEGRMKSALYVASVTRYYRQILDRAFPAPAVTLSDLETVFSRRTTKLYLDGKPASSPIDPESLGHLGAAVGTVKRVTRDREGQAWLRFHTSRALEKHDGLQFPAPEGGKPLGFGITLMRQALSRVPVFEVSAGADVEVLLPEALAESVKPGIPVYCSMSNAVKRLFPAPSYRPGDYPGDEELDVEVTLSPSAIRARATSPCEAEVSIPAALSPARQPGRTEDAVRTAFSKLGESDYRLGKLAVDDCGLFAPPRLLNDLRRALVEKLDSLRGSMTREKLEKALADDPLASFASAEPSPAKRLKIRPGQTVPPGAWDEIVVAVSADTSGADLSSIRSAAPQVPQRLALPVYTPEGAFNRLRVAVKRFLRMGFAAWEAADLATLRLLRSLGVEDITADWSLYAANASAVKVLSGLGVKRAVASPESSRANIAFLKECGFPVEFLAQQSTPLFISLTRPAAIPAPESGLSVYERDGLWVTVKTLPRTFDAPAGASVRMDLSWSPE